MQTLLRYPAFVLLIACTALPVLGELGPELIRNPGFEQDADDDGLPDHWNTGHDRVVLQETVFMGQNIAITSKPPTYVLATQDLTLKKGKTYTLTLAAKGHGGGIGGALIVHGPERPQQEMALLWNMDLTQTFEKYVRVFTAPNPVARIYLYNIAKTKGTVSYDHVSLRRGTPEHALIGQFSLKQIDRPVQPPREYPRIRYGTPLADGPIRAFVTIRHLRCLRQVVELRQRLDMDTDVVHTGYYGDQCVSATGRRAMKRLQKEFYEVYVVPSRLPKALADDIRERVEHGAGLVIVEGFGRAGELVDPNTMAPAPDNHALRHVFPLQDMPEDILADVQIGSLGKGRVARLLFPLDKARVWGLMPRESDLAAWRERQFEYWEWWEALLAETVRWAARGPPPTTISATYHRQNDRLTVTCTDDVAENLRVVVRSAREIRFDQSPLRRTAEQWLTLDEHGVANITIPDELPDGQAFAEVAAVDRNGNVLTWKAFALDRPAAATLRALELKQTVVNPGQIAHALVTAAAPESTNAVLRTRLMDAHGRVIDEKRQRLHVNSTPVKADVKLHVRHPLVVFHRVETQLLVNGREQDRLWTVLTVPDLGPRRAATDFTVIPWHPGMSHPLIVQRYTDVMKDIGQTGDFPGTGFLSAELGMPFAGYMAGMGRYFRETHQREDNVREACLHDPEIQQLITETAAAAGERSRDFGIVAAGITDEAFLTSRHHRHEVCFSEHSQNAYRNWLKKQYGTIQKLNRQWHTKFTDWNDIQGVKTEDVRNKRNVAPFVDFRTFMTDTWIATCARAVKAYQNANPGVPVGHTNTFGANPFNGNDYWKLATQTGFGWGQEYSEAIKPTAHKAVFDLWRSFCPENFFNYGWIGYHHSPEAARYEPWWLALHGAKGVSYYATNSLDPVRGISWSLVYPTISLTPFSLEVRDALKDIREGCGKLLMEYQPDQPDIGLLWSHPSMLVAWCESAQDQPVPDERPGCDSYGSYFRSALDFRQHVNELQMDYRYLAPQQLLQTETNDDLPRLLFLPFAVAMQPELVDRLERFVNQGGILIGDLRCLRTDQHGTPYHDSTPLKRLFGMRRENNATIQYNPGRITFHETANGLGMPGKSADVIGREQLHPMPQTKVLARHADNTPAAAVTTHGKGLAIYLNFRLPEYDPTIRSFLAQCLEAAGIDRPVSVHGLLTDNPPRCYERQTFTRDDNVLHAFIRDFRRCSDTNPVRITFDGNAHLYNVRKHMYLGQTESVNCTIPPGETAIFAMLPYRVKAVDLDVSTGNDQLALNARIQTAAPRRLTGHHVLHVNVIRPDGTPMATYPRNLPAPAGNLHHPIPLALNRPTGVWYVAVRDVITGVNSRRTVTVR